MQRQARLPEIFDQIAQFTPDLEFGSRMSPPPKLKFSQILDFGFWLSRPPPKLKFSQILALSILTFQITPPQIDI